MLPTVKMNVFSQPISEFKKDEASVKQLKQLCRKMTYEQLKMYDDTIFVCKYNNKIIGFCCVAMKSPESHFENENDREVAYLYNYICDIQHKKKKPSVALMNALKDKYDEMNLDTLIDNFHAKQFFEKNNFIKCGEYSQGIKQYDMFSYKKLT